MSTHATESDEAILAALALALVDTPRASLQELASAIGVSRATLYRFYKTREKLIERLFHHAANVVSEAIQRANLESGELLEALKRMIANSLEHREFTVFLMYYWKDSPVALDVESGWDATLDHFFLRGQHAGLFRIDISAPALTEIYVSLLIGLVEAERRGRVARHGLAETIESVFLAGAANVQGNAE